MLSISTSSQRCKKTLLTHSWDLSNPHHPYTWLSSRPTPPAVREKTFSASLVPQPAENTTYSTDNKINECDKPICFIRYRKPPNISTGLIFVRNISFLGGLYTGEGTYIWGAYIQGLIYGQDFVLVILTIYWLYFFITQG